MKFFKVGGCIRDDIMGIPTKDIDFAVETESFDAMRQELQARGFKIHTEKPEFLTIRCGIPKESDLFQIAKDADFVMCRKDSATSDGRRPDFVEPGTILDDLARRDFTMNAIAQDMETGGLLDPHNGIGDIEARVLRFVGNPQQRIREDGLRVLRGFRFLITKNLDGAEGSTLAAMLSPLATEMLGKVSVERIREELNKMLNHDQFETFEMIFNVMFPEMREAILRDGLRLEATLKE